MSDKTVAELMALADAYARHAAGATNMEFVIEERRRLEQAIRRAVDCGEDEHLLREALLALTYHREQTRPIADSDAVIERLRTRLWVTPGGKTNE